MVRRLKEIDPSWNIGIESGCSTVTYTTKLTGLGKVLQTRQGGEPVGGEEELQTIG